MNSPLHRERGTVGVMSAITLAAFSLAVLPVAATAITITHTAAADACTPAVSTSSGNLQPAPSATALRDIPATYLATYRTAGIRYGIPWTILAAIGKVESDHGRSNDPGIHTGANSTGAMGAMQFLAATWRTYATSGTTTPAHKPNVYDPTDAIPSAANYLRHLGLPAHPATAIYGYNHSHTYLTTVLSWARTYTATAPSTSATCHPPPSVRSNHPSGTASDVIRRKAINFALAQLGKPYAWGATGPDAYDCSGLIYAAYRSAGITLLRTTYQMWPAYPHIPATDIQPGDLAFYTGDGTPTLPGHVGLVLTPTTMIVAPHTGTHIQIQPTHQNGLVGYARPPT
jgi:cell wall-associated NlpC family hydrolase